jgi:hypothetical protein
MKLTIISIIAFTISMCYKPKPEFKSFHLEDKKVVIEQYSNQNDKLVSRSKFRVHRIAERKTFILNKDTIFLDYDSPPVFEEPLIPYFASRISMVQEVSPRYHIYTLCFVIDKMGNIIDYGFLDCNTDKVYRMQLIQIMQSINGYFAPAKVHGNDASVLYCMDLDFQTDDFRDALKK